jgi:iron-sulfur cluster assembly accessory protein
MGLLKIGRKGERNNDAPMGDASIAPLSPDQLGISAYAASYIKQLQEKNGDVNSVLRVAVRGGGCSGFSIHYEFTDMVRDVDYSFSDHGVRVVIDKKSLGVLGGATLHCRDYLGSTSFILVNNPNAKQCSCGQSFSL